MKKTQKDMNKVFTFWEGEMPAYIKLCMKSWDFPFVLLNYDNVNEYTNPYQPKAYPQYNSDRKRWHHH